MNRQKALEWCVENVTQWDFSEVLHNSLDLAEGWNFNFFAGEFRMVDNGIKPESPITKENWLVAKAIKNYNGVWPYKMEGLLAESTELNKEYPVGTFIFVSDGFNFGENWTKVCSKGEFENYMAASKQQPTIDWNQAPEGTTHYGDGSFYKVDGDYVTLFACNNEWEKSCNTKEWLDKNLIPRPTLRELSHIADIEVNINRRKGVTPAIHPYTPQVGEECEARDIGMTLSETKWRKCIRVGLSSKGKNVVEWLDTGEFDVYEVDEFRHLKTQAEIERDCHMDAIEANLQQADIAISEEAINIIGDYIVGLEND